MEFRRGPFLSPYAKIGSRDVREDQTTVSITVSDAVTGAATGSGSYVPGEDNNESATAGIRIKLEGGGMSHEINAGAAVSWQVSRNAYDFALIGHATNLYDPVVAPRPAPGQLVGEIGRASCRERGCRYG